jgi:hypothetical protein
MVGSRWVDEEGRRVSIEAMLCRPAIGGKTPLTMRARG